jgi:hypothetical protein
VDARPSCRPGWQSASLRARTTALSEARLRPAGKRRESFAGSALLTFPQGDGDVAVLSRPQTSTPTSSHLPTLQAADCRVRCKSVQLPDVGDRRSCYVINSFASHGTSNSSGAIVNKQPTRADSKTTSVGCSSRAAYSSHASLFWRPSSCAHAPAQSRSYRHWKQGELILP